MRVAEHHAAAIGADPQTVFGGDQRGDPSVRQCFFVATFMTQLTEFIAIEAIESVLGAEPHEPFVVLDDGVHGLLRQAFLEAVALHAEGRSRRGGARKNTGERGDRGARAQTDVPIFSPCY